MGSTGPRGLKFLNRSLGWRKVLVTLTSFRAWALCSEDHRRMVVVIQTRGEGSLDRLGAFGREILGSPRPVIGVAGVPDCRWGYRTIR